MLSFPKFLRQSYKQFGLPAPSVRQSSWLRPPKFCWWAGSAPLHPVLQWLHDLLYKNECQNWRNKINKAKKTSGFPADRLEEMLAAFESFKKKPCSGNRLWKRKQPAQRNFQAGFSGRVILLWNWLNQKTDTSAVNHFRTNNFLCPVAYAVHATDPCKLVFCFQFLRDSLCFFYLGNGTIQTVLYLLIQIGKICPQLSRQKQFIVPIRTILLQIFPVHPSPSSDGAALLRQL